MLRAVCCAVLCVCVVYLCFLGITYTSPSLVLGQRCILGTVLHLYYIGLGDELIGPVKQLHTSKFYQRA